MNFFQLSSREWINLAQITCASKVKDGPISIHLSDGTVVTEGDRNYADMIEEALKKLEYNPEQN